MRKDCLQMMFVAVMVALTATARAAHGSAAAAATAPAAAPVTCTDRHCYDTLVDDYLAAVVAHDPTRLPFAADVHFVENLKPTKIGDGLWKTASAVPTTFHIYVPDPVSQQVGFIGLMQEGGQPLLIALRLKVFGGEITEVEQVLARNIKPENLANLRAARAVFSRPVPKAQRMPRWLIKGVAYSYYDALDFNDGNLAPMAGDCERHENGMEASASRAPVTAQTEQPNYSAMDCTRQFNTGMMAYIDSIDNVRVLAVDPVNGLAFGLSHFHHAMKNHVFPIKGVPGVKQRAVNHDAFDLPAAHVFKISGGKIHQIEAMGVLAPYGSSTGW